MAARDDQEPGPRRLILMRGLPSCGKTHTSKAILEPGGVRIEVDDYYYKEVGDDPTHFDWSWSRRPAQQRWLIERVAAEVAAGRPQIIVDGMNTPNRTSWSYVQDALAHDYVVEFREPDSTWWQHLRGLLEQRERHGEECRKWAAKLTILSRSTQSVPYETFLYHMEHWELDVTIDDYARFAKERVA